MTQDLPCFGDSAGIGGRPLRPPMYPFRSLMACGSFPVGLRFEMQMPSTSSCSLAWLLAQVPRLSPSAHLPLMSMTIKFLPHHPVPYERSINDVTNVNFTLMTMTHGCLHKPGLTKQSSLFLAKLVWVRNLSFTSIHPS